MLFVLYYSLFFIFYQFFHVTALTTSTDIERRLYDLNLPNNKVINVSTIIRNVNRPVGIATGYFNNKPGVFVTSFVTSDIRFIETNTACEAAGNCPSILVAGTGFSGYNNGSLATATFSDPSRLVYIENLNILVVTDRANGYIRYIKFDSNFVGTMTASDGTKISIMANTRPDNQPGTDIKYYNNYLYVTDGINVYNITGSDGKVTSFNSAVLRKYDALRKWQLVNDYDSSNRKIYITSIAINSNRKVMYVSYTQSRSALVTVPLNCKSSSDISILYSDGVLWDSDKLFTIGYPKPRNGNLYSSPVSGYSLVTYPMHMYYDSKNDILYWTEIFSHLSSGPAVGALGAVALRRLNFATNEIDYYAGDEGVYRPILGRTTGSRDGYCNQAQFAYPMTVAYDTNGDALGPLLYVSDYSNNAIRKVYTAVNTPSPTLSPTFSVRPTMQPTISQRPTTFPSLSPTKFPSRFPSSGPTVEPSTSMPTTATPTSQPSGIPTGIPTSSPTVTAAPTKSMPPSSAPTELNGDCFELLLYDEFGDGWNGPVLYVNHTSPSPKRVPLPPDGRSTLGTVSHSGPSKVLIFTPSIDSSPQSHLICASLDEDRFFQRGTYKIEFGTSRYDSLHDVPYHWEVGFQLSTKSENFQNVIYGGILTHIEIEFTPEGIFKYKSIRGPIDQPKTCDICPHPPPPKPHVDSNSPKGHPLELYDDIEGFWFSRRIFPTRYVISDASKTKIVQSGMMCNHGDSEICDIILEDGDYYFRIGSEWDESEISWNFCGTQGKAQEEISFSIIGGHCRLGHQVSLMEILQSVEETYLTLEGHLLLENIFSSELSFSDQRLLESSLANSLDVSNDAIEIVSICETQPGVPCDNILVAPKKKPAMIISTNFRRLSQTYAYHITFYIKVKLEDVGGDEYIGTQYKHILKYVDEMKKKFDSVYQYGQLQTRIRATTETSSSESALQFVRLGKFSLLRLTDVNYEYTPKTVAPSISPVGEGDPLATIVVMDETQEQELLLATPLLFILGASMIVVVLTSMSRSNTPSEPSEVGDEKLPISEQINEEESDIFVQAGLSSIPDQSKIQRYTKQASWEPERLSLQSDNLSLP